jgi:uncharacterized damage-inducible protein DinB
LKIIPILILIASATVHAQTPASSANVGKIFDGQLRTIESEFVPLVEAMPADKMNFAPQQGAFKGVRTFGQQATHVATIIYAVSAAALGEKNPTDMGQNENGPASLNTKEAIVRYVKDAFTYGHKAMQNLTTKNLTDPMSSPFGSGKMARVDAASVAVWHSFDHYGQMVVYARMNGIVPPASRPK